MSIDEESIAYHEAGHFVASVVQGTIRYVYHVSITPRENELGSVSGEEPPIGEYHGHEIIVDRQSVEDIIVNLYCGRASQSRHKPSDLGVCGDDDRQADKYLDYLEVEDKKGALERQLRTRADRLVADNWSAIEALTAELLREKELSVWAAELVIDVACGRESPEMLEQYRQMPGMRH